MHTPRPRAVQPGALNIEQRSQALARRWPAGVIPHSRPRVGPRAIAAVVRALRAGRLSQCGEVDLLERDLSRMFDGFEVVVVSSGTAALLLALLALGIRKGARVIIPSYACPSLYAAVSYSGAEALCADTGVNTVCVTPATVEALLSRSVGAAIVPHLFGFEADVKGIAALGIPVIEDCAQSVGGRSASGVPLGTQSDIAVLSFYGTKLAPAGEGGACVTRWHNLARFIRRLRNCDERAPHPLAFNFKMSDLSAALARAQLKELSADNRAREKIARAYDRFFGSASFRVRTTERQAVCFRYLLDLEQGAPKPSGGRPAAFIARAARAGIACRRPVWSPLHRSLGGRCPQTERWHASLVSVPVYPGLSKPEKARICRVLPGMLNR